MINDTCSNNFPATPPKGLVGIVRANEQTTSETIKSM